MGAADMRPDEMITFSVRPGRAANNGLEWAGAERRPVPDRLPSGGRRHDGALYAFVLEPALPQNTAFKGWFYAIARWLINAAIILPATGKALPAAPTSPPQASSGMLAPICCSFWC
jgi:hypothetical protein